MVHRNLKVNPPVAPVPPSRLRPFAPARAYPCLVAQPADRAANPGRHPLLLFLHGAGERGAQLEAVTRYGPPRLLAGGAELSPPEQALAEDMAERFVVVAPQCPHYEIWDEGALLRLLDEIRGGANVDPARVYVTGLSMGGFGAWTLGLRHPERFAAVVPICGGGRIRDVTSAADRQGQALRTLGVWAFHGARDGVVPLEESRRIIDALQQVGATDTRLTVDPEAGHDSWTAAYGNRELYSWLLRHRRSEPR